MNRYKNLFYFAIILVLASAVALWFRPHGKAPGEVLILCGGSMRAAMDQVIERYKKVSTDKVLISYGDSSEFTVQLQKTRKGDVLVCHDPFMPWASELGLIDQSANVARLDIVIVVPKDNPKGIREFKDLGRTGLRLGLSDPTYSTAGQVEKEILEKVDYGPSIKKNILLETRGHQALCTDVQIGSLDAAIVWNAVAHQWSDKLLIIPIPTDNIPAIHLEPYKKSDMRNINVTIGITRYAQGNERVRRFYEFAIAQKDIFAALGFAPVKE
ncbi:MAG: substrate-binding domain-containing protein [Kiritimatiellae bacterium]|nr:substrate-binding domain-containing protein [Kiritimatiellia bacterium]MDD5523005.1 substrate-binding domain-containing protein [Kiritimatiellia bacterium]